MKLENRRSFAVVNSILKLSLKFFFNFLLKDINKDRNVAKTIAFYQDDKNSNEFIHLFSKIRFWDSPFWDLEKIVPKKGTIIDLGCGDGIFVNYLALTSTKRKLIGLELNKDRIKYADKHLKNTKFISGDVRYSSIPKADVILMVHLLHHLSSRKDQELLIDSCIRKLNTGGKLIIAEVGSRPLIKYIFSYITDTIIVPILFEKKLFNPDIFYRSRKQWESLLESKELKVQSKDLHSGKPFSHIILIGVKNDK